MDQIEYRPLTLKEVNISLFNHFDRKQIVSRCWRKIDGKWVIKDIGFIDDWSHEEYVEGADYLKNLILRGGCAVGAFAEGHLKGFMSVEPALFGSCGQYMDMSNIHVSQDMRNQGIGKELFVRAKEWAKAHGAKKLYISAHSAVESQAFYKAMGCVEAEEYNQELVDREPCDCQLECIL